MSARAKTMSQTARIVVAAPSSGSGKTSVATGLLAALRARGLAVSPHKVGPDFIDPSYHSLAAGRPGRNLDPWLVGEDLIAPLFAHGAAEPVAADVAVVEGVMGLFDGAADRPGFASTAHVAQLLAAPVLLVVDATGMGRSVAALVHGFATYDPSVRIGGVVLNRVGTARHEAILTDALTSVGVPVLGAIPRRPDLTTPSRHLGLIPAVERSAEAEATVDALGDLVAATVDIDAVLDLAGSAPELPTFAAELPPLQAAQGAQAAPRVRIALAGGAAFTFGYAEQPELLAAAGAEVITFDPLVDEKLPDDIDGLVIGGGFPETYADELSRNASMRASVAEAARAGLPIAAECGGLLYLGASLDTRPMCGVLDVEARMTDQLTLGYRAAVAAANSALFEEGARVRGHEFHRTITSPAASATPAWNWHANGESVREGFVAGSIHASYLHLHWAGVPGVAERFVNACAGRVAG